MDIKADNIYIPVANEQITIPTLYSDGSIMSFNFLSMKYRGLVEITGEEMRPLIKPVLKINDKQMLGRFNWKRENYWTPSFVNTYDDIEWQGEICTPINERGFYYFLKVSNNSKKIKTIDMGLEGTWAKTVNTINESKNINANPTAFASGWSNSLVFELIGETPILAFAPIADIDLDNISWLREIDGSLNYRLTKSLNLNPGEDFSIVFYWGVGLEEVGAATAAKEIYRKGLIKLKKDTFDWLNARILTTGDNKLDEVMNLNLFFNYFFATGKTLDTEEYVSITSRSPRYYVSASYWDRDSLLWSFPSLLLTDRKMAKSILDYAFKVQGRNIGTHSRYIDGIVLEPGFELDELCAPIIALDMYLSNTDDWEYIKEDYVQRALKHILETLEQHRHSELELYDTFLQPTDDPIVYPYLTYNNALVAKVFTIFSNFAINQNNLDEADYFKLKADDVKQSIYSNMVVKHQEKEVFAWSIDLKGNYNIYDEPPGSLQLLPYYGFCSEEDQVYKNTIELIHSKENPFAFHGYEFEELGCSHAEHPWVLSIANSFLSGRKEQAKNLIVRATMDGGIACESIDENTGQTKTGEHFATCAGFLAYSIYHAFGKIDIK